MPDSVKWEAKIKPKVNHNAELTNRALVQEAHLRTGNAVQIIGKVNPDLSIRVFSALDLGAGVGMLYCPPNLLASEMIRLLCDPYKLKVRIADPPFADFGVCQNVVEISQKYKHLFDMTA